MSHFCTSTPNSSSKKRTMSEEFDKFSAIYSNSEEKQELAMSKEELNHEHPCRKSKEELFEEVVKNRSNSPFHGHYLGSTSVKYNDVFPSTSEGNCGEIVNDKMTFFNLQKDDETIQKNKTMVADLLRNDHMVKVLCDLLDNDLEVIPETRNTSVQSSPAPLELSVDEEIANNLLTSINQQKFDCTPRNTSCNNVSTTSPQTPEIPHNTLILSSPGPSTKFVTDSCVEDSDTALKTLIAVRDCLCKNYGADKENMPLTPDSEKEPFLMTPDMFLYIGDGDANPENRDMDSEENIPESALTLRKYLLKKYSEGKENIAPTPHTNENKSFLKTPIMNNEDGEPIAQNNLVDVSILAKACVMKALHDLLNNDPDIVIKLHEAYNIISKTNDI